MVRMFAQHKVADYDALRARGARRAALRLTLATTLVVVALALPTAVFAQDEVGTGTMEQPRDIAISMDDTLRFEPAEVTVGAGEVVRFVLTNTGAATHDFLIGDLETQEEHGAEMAAGMTHGHDACPEAADEHMDEADEHADEAMDDGDMMGDEASHMPDDEAMGHSDEADEHMDEADDHVDGAAEHTDEGLCPGGVPAAVTIEPGETVSVLARLDEPGETLYGCHQPGHWEVGMMGTITIVDNG